MQSEKTVSEIVLAQDMRQEREEALALLLDSQLLLVGGGCGETVGY